MQIEIGTHPEDLNIECREAVDFPDQYATNFYRGEGHRYKLLLTCDRPEALAKTREDALRRIRSILTESSLLALYHGHAPDSLEQFVSCMREAGYTTERFTDGQLARGYDALSTKGPDSLLGAMIDPSRVLNASMIEEIMGRFATSDTVDTSQEPLQSLAGLLTP